MARSQPRSCQSTISCSATEPLGDRAHGIFSKPVAVADTKFVVNYWRLSEDNRRPFGGGESYGYRFPNIHKTVLKPMLEVYPQLKDTRIDYAWGGTLAITMNRMPCLACPAPGILSASGLFRPRCRHGHACGQASGRSHRRAIVWI